MKEEPEEEEEEEEEPKKKKTAGPKARASTKEPPETPPCMPYIYYCTEILQCMHACPDKRNIDSITLNMHAQLVRSRPNRGLTSLSLGGGEEVGIATCF